MSSTPLVSVIIPTYNRADRLLASVQSVLDQDFNDFELFIIDDASTDETQDVVQQIQDERVTYIRLEQNSGAGLARNRGIELARGELIAFNDSDDHWLPGKLKKQVEILKNHVELGGVFANYLNINEQDHSEEIGFEQTRRGLRLLQTVALENGFQKITGGFPESLLKANYIALPTMILRRECFQKVGLFINLWNAQDFELWWRLGAMGISLAFTKDVLLRRIKPSGSLSSGNIKGLLCFIDSLDANYQTSLKLKRNDLLPYFKTAYRSAWNWLIREHALSGNRKEAIKSFTTSLRYGITPRTLYLLAGAIVGPRLIRLIQKKA